MPCGRHAGICLTCGFATRSLGGQRVVYLPVNKHERAAEDPSLIPHGTWAGRNNWGCTCQPCRDAWAEYMRDYRQRRMAATGERIYLGRFVAS
jgi:hypothetical protein